MKVKQCLIWPCARQPGWSMEDVFAEAARIGFQAVEFHFEEKPEEIIDGAHRHGLAVASMCGHGTLVDGLNDPANHDRIEEELRRSIALAARHGVAGLICFSGNRRPGQDDYEGLVECARGLRRVAGLAEEKGVNLNLELLNSRIDHPGYQADRTTWGVALCEMVGSLRVKLLFDIYHMQIMEGDVIRSLRRHIGHIGHFHTAGNPGRKDLDDEQELNYRGICRAIAASGYEGYVGHEFFAKGDRMEAMRQAFAVCD